MIPRAAVVIVALVLATLAARVDTAGATSECQGFMVCVPVAGPWVVVPVSRATPRPQVQYQLTCPRGYVVGGLDAELTDRAIDVWFLGATGSPVAPGRTTSRTVVFVATYVGSGTAPQTFRPHAGCLPAQGGGRRTPTSVRSVFPPGKPTVRRVKTFRITAARTVALGCRRDEHLVAAYSAAGFRTKNPPSATLVASLSTRSALASNHITVSARGGQSRAVLQVAAVCAGGK